MITTVFTLLIAYQIKHWLCDFPLQTPYMIGKFKETGWIAPLAAHAGVHAAFTAVIALFCAASVWTILLVAALDFTLHFTMDRIKASPKLMGRWKPVTGPEYLRFTGILNHTDGNPIPHAEQTYKEAESRLRGNTLFWLALGFDQCFHHLTHYLIIAILVLL
jgi:hypothetical protein